MLSEAAVLKGIASGLLALFVVSSLFSIAAFAGEKDWHLSASGNRAFFLRSAFAHGYMHGYEMGFHEGDMDLQMGRTFQAITKQDEFNKVHGYRPGFGDRGSFDEGYRKGYAVGYTDCYAGRNFRATILLDLANSHRLAASEATPDRNFDRAFTMGYELGAEMGLKSGRAPATLENTGSINCSGVAGTEDCAAYRDGYRLGYSDGYTNRNGSGAVLARK